MCDWILLGRWCLTGHMAPRTRRTPLSTTIGGIHYTATVMCLHSEGVASSQGYGGSSATRNGPGLRQTIHPPRSSKVIDSGLLQTTFFCMGSPWIGTPPGGWVSVCGHRRCAISHQRPAYGFFGGPGSKCKRTWNPAGHGTSVDTEVACRGAHCVPYFGSRPPSGVHRQQCHGSTDLGCFCVFKSEHKKNSLCQMQSWPSAEKCAPGCLLLTGMICRHCGIDAMSC